MNISEGFIKRPIATSLLMAAIALFGIVAYRALPVSDLPNIDFPTLLVTAQLPGASPETMGASVATPLESQFSMIAGLQSMTSVNSLGSTQVTLEFDLNRSLDGAAVDVQAAITQAARLLPQGMPTPPTFTKVNPADQPILYLVITSSTLPPWTLDEYAETRIAQRISMVSGVAQVQVLGSQKYAVHVQLDPHLLASKQIGINEVENALRVWNVNTPAGTVIGPHKAFTLQATGQLMTAAEYKDMIVTYRNGAPVRLSDLGDVVDGVEDQRTASWFYKDDFDQRAITLGIQRQPGTNTIAVADAVKALLPQFKIELPASVHMDVLYDRSDTIRDSYRDVQFTMALTLALVVFVIYVFLRNVWATVIPSLALPFSIIGTFAVMYMLGYSLDNLSMMALILSIGFVVDDAIVMLENIYRHVELGEDPLTASLVGSREIGFTIVSMTVSLTAVFIPMLFMGGVLGRLFREFSVTICVAILISGVVSVTLTPMLCSRFLKPHGGGHGDKGAPKKESKFGQVTEAAFDGLLRGYDHTLQIVLRHRPATMAVFVVVLVLTGWLFIIVPKGFIPEQDTDQIAVTTEAAQGASFEQLVKYQAEVAEVLRRNPNVEGLVSTIGGAAANTLGGPNLGQIVVHLKPRSERSELANDIIAKLRPEFEHIAGMRVYLQNPPTVRIGGQVSKSLYQYSMQSPDHEALYSSARKLLKALADVPGIEDLTSDLAIESPQVNVEINRDKAASLGVNVSTIENALYDAYGPRWVSTIYAPVNEYKVLLELQPEFQADPSAMSLLYFKATPTQGTGAQSSLTAVTAPPGGTGGIVVPLDTLANTKQVIGPQAVNHKGQLAAVTISFGLKPGASLGDVLSQVRTIADATLPETVSGDFQGAADAFQSSLGNLAILLVIAVLVVYIVLGILYESYIHPLTILSGLPSAAFGALVTLILFRMELNIYGFVGIIMLLGIVEKNAIMQIDFALEAERSGKSAQDAIYEGCLIRFRPIMMTTMAALFGAVPIALGYGAGGEARQPLGLVVVGGLLFSQLITLYLTPVFYTYMARLQAWLGSRKKTVALKPVTVHE
ncbi:MAG: efflux RND transporter permease subunit [Acidobacteriaceae bacterium]|jgi:HAE1 family hydrophobic/amphiphilic exporter-1|nr:efflux RND transporter permease subunit [Acidobacteriaceae bacterium]